MTSPKDKGYHQLAPLDLATGKRLVYGNGCHAWDNCFTCPFPGDKCKFGQSGWKNLLKRGDNIKEKRTAFSQA